MASSFTFVFDLNPFTNLSSIFHLLYGNESFTYHVITTDMVSVPYFKFDDILSRQRELEVIAPLRKFTT